MHHESPILENGPRRSPTIHQTPGTPPSAGTGRKLSTPFAKNRVGSRIGPYVVEAPLGQGGMGAVYRARHESTGAIHALKVIHARRLDAARAEVALARFRREAEVLARIEGHPHIVRIHASGVDDGVPWCAMELVDGRSLADVIVSDGRLSPRRAAEMLEHVARAVHHAHRLGVVHRDLKPENVLVDAAGRPHVVDFGLAYDAFADELTRTGELLGTPAFMAPEQINRSSTDIAGRIGPATDVYGLGGLLYAAVTGHAPFEGESPVSLLVDIVRTPPKPPRAHVPELPASIEKVCLHALEKHPDRRHRSAGAFADDLARWLAGESVASAPGSRLSSFLPAWVPRRRSILALVAVSAIAAGGAVIAMAGGLFGEPPRERLDAFARRLELAGALGAADRDQLATLAASEELAAAAPDQARRAELLARLAAIVSAPPAADGRSDAIAVAKLLRGEATAPPDRALLGFAARVLRDGSRWVELDVVLHGVAPAATGVDPMALAALARAMAASDAPPTLRPPLDADAFGALHGAPGLGAPDRARLLAARGARLLAEGDLEDHPAALDALLDARAADDVRIDGRGWPLTFRNDAVLRLADLSGSDPARARALSELLVRSADKRDRLPPATIGELQQAAGISTVLGASLDNPTEEQVERMLTVDAVLESFGASSFHPGRLPGHHEGMPPERFVTLAEAEAARSPGRRCPARLLILAFLVNDTGLPGADGFVAAAAETGIDEPWLHYGAGDLLYRHGQRAKGLEHLERALTLERELPDARRAPLFPERLAYFALVGRPERSQIDRAARLIVEAYGLQGKGADWLQSIANSGGMPPWPRNRERRIAALAAQVARVMIETRRAPSCCDTIGDTPDPERLLGLGLELMSRPIARVYGAFDAESGDTSEGELLSLRAAHRFTHGRHADALADLDTAIDLSLSRGSPNSAQQREHHLRLAQLYESRGRLRIQLGRRAEGEADRRAAVEQQRKANGGR